MLTATDPQDDWTFQEEVMHYRRLENIKADLRIAIKDVLAGNKDEVRLLYCAGFRNLSRNDLGALLTEHLDDAQTATLAQASFDKEARIEADGLIDGWIELYAKETIEHMDEMGMLNEHD